MQLKYHSLCNHHSELKESNSVYKQTLLREESSTSLALLEIDISLSSNIIKNALFP